MTISNGSSIIASDLNTLISTELGLLATDNAQLPLGFVQSFTFPNLVSGTGSTRRKARFVAPFDCYLEALCVQAADQTASSTVKAAVTGDDTLVDNLGDTDDFGEERGLAFWPVKVSGTAGAGITLLSRLLFDNTKKKVGLGGNFATSSKAFRLISKGSTLLVSASTTSVATPSCVQVALAVRQFFARE